MTDSQPLNDNSASQVEELFMEWEAVEDKRNSEDWRVEANDYEDEGKVYVTVFSGPNAKDRATEYADFKNEQRIPLRKAS